MATDRLHVKVVPLSSETAQSGILQVNEIGVSEIEDYLAEAYSPDVPEGERARRASRRLLDSMTALSTDEEYDILAQLDPEGWFPHWLGLVEPVVDSARQTSNYINLEFTTRENNPAAARQPIDEDLQYVFSLFSLSSFAVTAELGLKHPSDLPDMVTARTDTPSSGQASDEMNREIRHDLLQAMSISRQVPSPHRRKLKRIQEQAEKVIEDSVAFMPRLVEVIKLAHEAKKAEG